MYNFYKLNYLYLYYYYYSLIISSYHNYARSPSAQIPRYHNDPGTRAQPLGPNVLLFKFNLIYIGRYYYCYIIFISYHTKSLNHKTKISLYHNIDPARPAQLLKPYLLLFKFK